MAKELVYQSASTEDDPLSGLESIVPARANKPPSTATISFNDLLQPPLLLHEDLKEGCGGQLWPAGMVLAKYMLHAHRDEFANKTMWVRLAKTD